MKTVAVLKHVKNNAGGYLVGLLLWQQRLTEEIEQVDDTLVAEDMELLGAVALQRHAYEPNSTKDMVGMRVGDEEMTDVAPVDTCQPQLGQYAIAAASVNQKPGAVEALQHKTPLA